METGIRAVKVESKTEFECQAVRVADVPVIAQYKNQSASLTIKYFLFTDGQTLVHVDSIDTYWPAGVISGDIRYDDERHLLLLPPMFPDLLALVGLSIVVTLLCLLIGLLACSLSIGVFFVARNYFYYPLVDFCHRRQTMTNVKGDT